MRHITTLLILIFSTSIFAQNNVVKTAGVSYTAGAPTFSPGRTGSQVAIDTVTGLWYEHNGTSWSASGYRVQTISGCSAPNYTPTKYQSRLVINACTAGQGGPELYYYTGSVWLQINEGGGGGGPDSTLAKTNDTYTGKRIGDNVYKYGTMGIGTKDTTGPLNIATSSASRPAISVINTPIFLKYKRGSMPGWYLQQKSASNTDGTTNNALELMYNWYGAGNAEVAGDGQFGISLEPHWVTGLGDTVAEAHIPMFYDVKGNAHRFITFFMDFHNKKDRSSMGFGMDQIHFDGTLASQETKIVINKTNASGYYPMEIYGRRKTINTTSTTYTPALLDSVTNLVVGNHRKDISTPIQGAGSLMRFDANQERLGRFYMGVVAQSASGFDGYSDFIGYYNTSNNFKEAFRVADQTGYFGIQHGGTSRPAQPLDVNGASHFRGSVRVNMVGDSAAQTWRYASSQTAPLLQLKSFAGSDLLNIHAYNPTSNPSLVLGLVGSINATSPGNLIFGRNPSANFQAGAGNNAIFTNGISSAWNLAYENSFFGAGVGAACTDCFQNFGGGPFALNKVTTGYQLMALGRQAMLNCTTGNTSVAAGSNSLQTATAPVGFVAVGAQAAQLATTAEEGVVLGNLAGRAKTTIVRSVLIGPNVANSAGSVTDQLWIDNTNTATPLIGADFANNRVGINTAPGSIAASSILEITSTTQGVLLPRMTSTQRDAIPSPATGLTLYCTDCTATDASSGVMQTYNGATWKNNW